VPKIRALGGGVEGPAPNDLHTVRVATVAATTSEAFLESERINYRAYPSSEEALEALLAAEIDALVYDQPILRYFARVRFPGRIVVLDQPIGREDYGIALPSGSALREPINRLILRSIQEEWWEEMLERYMGR
jgi:ABC-type amino acid transport substrate-binding protein